LFTVELAGVNRGVGRLDALLAIAITDQAGGTVKDTDVILERTKPRRNSRNASVAIGVAGFA
jgi:hypothetical protein